MLTPRAARNKWHKVNGIFTKYVDDEEHLLDSVDLTDELEEHQAISSAAFDDVSGVTLGTPSIDSSGQVSFTHEGVGSAVLLVVLDFSAYLAELKLAEYLAANYNLKVTSAGGVGVAGAAGDLATVFHQAVVPPVDSAMAHLLDAYYVRVLLASGAYSYVENMAIIWDTTNFCTMQGTLINDLSAADSGAAGVSSLIAEEYDDFAEYDAYLVKPTQTRRVPLSFVDPSTSDTDYTP